MATSSLPGRSRNKKRYRRYFLFIILVLIAALITTLYYKGNTKSLVDKARGYANDITSPLQSEFESITNPIGNFLADAVNNNKIERQQRLLEQQIAHIKSMSSNKYSPWMLQTLSRLNSLPFAANYNEVFAQVITQGASNYELAVVIDKGSDQGVEAGMPVVDGAGLIGRVIQAGKDTSTVLLITDARTSASVAILNKTGSVIGLLNGQGSNALLSVAFVNPGSNVKVGDQVFTSGQQGDLYPAGLFIGTVSSVKDSPGSLQMQIKVKPAADFSALSYVAVLQWLPSP